MDLKKTGKLRNRFSATTRDSLKVFFFLLLIFGIFAHTVGDNENSRFDTTISIVEQGTISINHVHNNTGDKALLDGVYYSDKAPLSSFLAVPSYMLVNSQFNSSLGDDSYLESFRRSHSSKMEWGRFAATVSVSAVAGALISAIIYATSVLLGLKRNRAILLGIIAGLGTLVFPYSTTFHGTILGTCLLAAAVFTWIKEEYRTTGKNTELVSLLIGLGVSSSYLVAIPGGILLFLNSVDRLKEFEIYLKASAGLLVGLTPLFIFNILSTGNPIEPTMLHAVDPTNTTSADPEGQLFKFSIGKLMAARIARALVSPLNGLFAYSPVLLFGIIGLKKAYWTEKKLFWLVTGSFVTTLVLLSFIAMWPIRAFYGVRYLLPVSTLLVLPLALELKASNRLKRSLIYLSGLLSTFAMLGSTQPWKGYSWIASTAQRQHHVTGMTSLGIYDNRLLTYLENIFSEGLQSPILSYLTGSSSEFHMVLSSYPQYSFPVKLLGNLFTYDVRVLIVVLIALSGLILFREKLPVPNTGLMAAGALLLVLALTGVSTPSHYMHDWYDEKPEENTTWGREQPDIHFRSESNTEKLLELQAEAYGEQDFRIFLNGKNVRNTSLGSRETGIVENVNLEEGWNRLSFRTDRCQVIGRFARNKDTRCVTLGLKNYNLTTIRDKYVFDSMEKTPEGHRSVDSESRVLTNVSGNYSLEFEASSDSTTELDVVKDGEILSNSRVDGFPSTIRTPYVEIDGVTSFNIQKTCKDCDLTIQDFQLKEYSQQNETFRTSTNWYNKVETENRIWTPGNGTILVYNYRDRNVQRQLTVDGRSFEKPRNISFVLNNELLGVRESPTTAYRILDDGTRTDNRFSFMIDLRPGENILELKTNESCSVIGDVIGNNDIRCVIYGFESIELKEIQ